MANVGRPRTFVDQRLRNRLAELTRNRGVRAAARECGLSRDALLGLIAGTAVQAGTVALAERWDERTRESKGWPAA